jgi:hypothetical protein
MVRISAPGLAGSQPVSMGSGVGEGVCVGSGVGVVGGVEVGLGVAVDRMGKVSTLQAKDNKRYRQTRRTWNRCARLDCLRFSSISFITASICQGKGGSIAFSISWMHTVCNIFNENQGFFMLDNPLSLEIINI